MRKETIVKYESVFLAWCRGADVLMGYPTSMSDRTLSWRPVKVFSDWKPLDTIYILDDKYSTFRRALSEGKTLEWAAGGGHWIQYDLKYPFSYTSANQIRIKPKPDELKFKVGDWVCIHSTSGISSPIKYEDHSFGAKGLFVNGGKNWTGRSFKPELKHWKPQPGEWCWFWNKEDSEPILRQFKEMSTLEKNLRDGYKYSIELTNIEHKTETLGKSLKYCEPFIGTLPSHLRDN